MNTLNLPAAARFVLSLLFIICLNLVTNAQIAGMAPARNALEVDPPIVNFGNASVNKVSDLILHLSNTGAADLTITDIIHANPSFVIAGSTPITIPPGETKAMAVSFVPVLLGSQTDTLKIFSNDADQSLTRIPLSGTGTVTPLPELSVQPLELQFDSVLVGLPKPAKLRLYNRGAGNLTINRIAANNGSFMVTTSSSHLLLAPGESADLTIDFKPTQLGVQIGTLSIESDDANENPLTLSMRGLGKAIPAPTLTGIAPVIGTRLQSLEVGFKGTNFISAVSRLNLGPNIAADSVTVHRADSLTAKITITENAATGSQGFSVTNSGLFGGGTSANQSFTVINPVPVLSNVMPDVVFRGEAQNLTLTGAGFIDGVTTVSLDADITLNSVNLMNSSTLSVNVKIAASAAIGPHNLSVTNASPGGGTSAQLTFTVNTPPPTLAHLTPSSGNRLQTLNVGFKGSNFFESVSSVNAGPHITVNSFKVHRPDSLTANITIAAEAEVGPRNFSIVNSGAGGGTSGTQEFTVNNPLPTFVRINPASGERLQTLNVGCKGANFIPDATTVSFGAGIKVNNVIVHRLDSLTANILIGANADMAPRSVEITNPGPGGGTFSDVAFAVRNPKPTLARLSPTTALRRQTLNLVLTGTKFMRGVTAVNVGDDFVVNSTTVNSPTSLIVNLTIPAAADLGPREVSVTNPAPGGGTSSAQTFTIINYEPTKPQLLLPANSTVITLSRQPPPIQFVWRRSFDGDAGDTLSYALNIKGPSLDTTLAAVKDTSVILNIIPRLKVDSEYSWGVQVSDGVVNVTWPDRFVFLTSKIITAVDERRNPVPSEYRLEQNYPNPFTSAAKLSATTIKYQLPQASEVTLTIYDALGQEVATLVNALQPPGYYNVVWNGKNSHGKPVPGGVYIYRLRAGSFERVMKMMVVH